MSQVGVFLRLFGQLYLALGAKPLSQFFGSIFLAARLSSESLEPLIGFLVSLERIYSPKPKIGEKLIALAQTLTRGILHPRHSWPYLAIKLC